MVRTSPREVRREVVTSHMELPREVGTMFYPLREPPEFAANLPHTPRGMSTCNRVLIDYLDCLIYTVCCEIVILYTGYLQLR